MLQVVEMFPVSRCLLELFLFPCRKQRSEVYCAHFSFHAKAAQVFVGDESYEAICTGQLSLVIGRPTCIKMTTVQPEFNKFNQIYAHVVGLENIYRDISSLMSEEQILISSTIRS